MKKVLVVLLLICIVLPVAVFAGPPHEDVEGYFTYEPLGCDVMLFPGPNAVWRNCTDVGDYYEGSFLGVSTEVYHFIMRGFQGMHPDFGYPLYERGEYKGTVTFDGSVGDKEGTMEIMFVGTGPSSIDYGFTWNGSWRISHGTGDLAGIHGSGQWSNSTNPDFPGVHYWGQIHYAP